MMPPKKEDFIFVSILYVLSLILIHCTTSIFWETFCRIFEKKLLISPIILFFGKEISHFFYIKN